MKLLIALILALTLSATAALAGPPLRHWVKNGSQVTISELYIKIAAADEWGEERLRGKTIEQKGKMQFMLEDGVDKCHVAFKLRSTAGKEYHSEVRLCEDHTYVFRGRP